MMLTISMCKVSLLFLMVFSVITPWIRVSAEEAQTKEVLNEENAPKKEEKQEIYGSPYGDKQADTLLTYLLDKQAGNIKRNFDEIDRYGFNHLYKKYFTTKNYLNKLNQNHYLKLLHKKNFDEIDRTGFNSFNKRNFDEIDRTGFNTLYKKNFDEIDRTGFNTLYKKNFDEIDRTGFNSFNKRNFDEIDRTGFNTLYKKNFDEIDRTGFNSFNKRNFDEIDRTGFNSFTKRNERDGIAFKNFLTKNFAGMDHYGLGKLGQQRPGLPSTLSE